MTRIRQYLNDATWDAGQTHASAWNMDNQIAVEYMRCKQFREFF